MPMSEQGNGRLITICSIQGHLAQWAVRQHPYRGPDGLFEVVHGLGEAASQWADGVASLRMQRFATFWELAAWIERACTEHCPKILLAWNTPRSDHKGQMVSSSRYDSPAPDDDFIDLTALFRNTALSAWREAEEIDGSPAGQPPLVRAA